MGFKRLRKVISRWVGFALLVTVALLAAGCGKDGGQGAAQGAVIAADGQVLGEGGKAFSLTVADLDGNEIHAEIHTDEETVGDALEALGVIAGEDSPTGIYVKSVNGITADYDKDGSYWAFYVDGEYAQTGVGSTPAEDGGDYAFRAEKA